MVLRARTVLGKDPQGRARPASTRVDPRPDPGAGLKARSGWELSEKLWPYPTRVDLGRPSNLNSVNYSRSMGTLREISDNWRPFELMYL